MTQHFRQARFNLYNIQNFYKYKKLAELATKNSKHFWPQPNRQFTSNKW